MRQVFRHPAGSIGLAVVISTFCFNLLLSGAPPDQKHISIFSNVATYSLPVTDSRGHEYAGLLEVLEPLGKVSIKADSKRWRLRYENLDLEFNRDKSRVRMKGGDFDLGDPVEVEAGRVMVPVSTLAPLLSRILGGPVTYDPASARIFIGNIGVHFGAQIVGDASPSLVMNFSAPVNPTIATSAGKLRMTFTHEPIVSSGTRTLTFNNKSIMSAAYEDGNGNASITVNGGAPLFANFSSDRKTITISAAPSANPQVQGATAPAASVKPSNNPVQVAVPGVPSPIQAPSLPPTREYFAVVDAGHGGSDRGAALSAQLVEKDLTLAFARRLQQEMESKGLPTLLLRNGDADISLDDRAAATNSSHANIYICIHVTSQGNGVNLYTAMLPTGGQSRGPFVNWETAQAPSLARSEVAIEILANSLENSKIEVRKLTAPLRPLNNITTAAIALEIAPPAGGAQRLDSSGYQQLVASALANGIAVAHQRIESGR